MSNDIEWARKWHSVHCCSNSKEVRDYAKSFQRGHWSLLGPGNEGKWCGTYSQKPEGKWDCEVNQMITHFAESGRSIFQCTSALNRRILKRKRGRNAKHFTAELVKSKHWTFTSHNSLGKSAQYLRSSIELVWWVRWTDAWSDILGTGQIHFQNE